MSQSRKKAPKNGPKISESSPNAPVVIKKYPNRRLYNTTASSYIVQSDVIDLVKAGTPFVIEDAKSGEDITRTILNQIIFDQETKPSDYLFPLEFQKQIISMYGDTYGHMLPDYLTQSINLFASERSRMNEAFGDMIGRNTNAFMEYSRTLAKQNLDLFRRSWEAFGAMGGATPGFGEGKAKKSGENETESTTSDSRANELEDIQSKIDSLQERLKSLK